jgi:hypothetical protein
VPTVRIVTALVGRRAMQLGHFGYWAKPDCEVVGQIRPIYVPGIKIIFPFVFNIQIASKL